MFNGWMGGGMWFGWIFWRTKNGLKMTGMPAWGKTHSDEKIWALVAFMKKRKMNPDM